MSGLKQKIFVDLDMNDQDIFNALTGIVFTNDAVVATDSIRTAIGKLAGSVAFGLFNYNIQSSSPFITTSPADSVITSMTITPISGNYVVLYSGSCLLSTNNSICTTSIYKNAAASTDSIRTIQAAGGGWVGVAAAQSVISMNGTDLLTIQTKISTGQLTVTGRSLILLRIGA